MSNKLVNRLQDLRNDIALITVNETLNALSNEYCDLLENSNIPFLKRKVSACLKDLMKLDKIDYDERIKSAYDAYNEAVVYYELSKKCQIFPIPETSKSTPDFLITLDENTNVYLEVKSLAFAGGNSEYRKGQMDALEGNIKIEKQLSMAKQNSKSKVLVASAEREVCPMGRGTLQEQLNKIIMKIENNYKKEQFENDNSIIGVDMNQIGLSFKKEDCRAIVPSFNNIGYSTGILWAIACGREGDSFFVAPEFEGKPNIDKTPLAFKGILNAYPSINAVMFFLGKNPNERYSVGFYRYTDSDLAAAQFIRQVCTDYNDDRNSKCY